MIASTAKGAPLQEKQSLTWERRQLLSEGCAEREAAAKADLFEQLLRTAEAVP
jgi:hypothetical protein